MRLPVILVCLLVLFSLSVAPANSAPVPAVYVRDYATCNGGDDTAGIQLAIDTFINGQRSGGPGTLDFGSCNYLVSSTLRFERADGGPWFGTVRGDGPEATTIRSYPGMRAAEVRGMKYGEFGGIKFSGGPDKSSDLNHAGLVIGDPGLVNGVRFHNLTFEHFGLGLGVGDINTGGAAAELTFENIGASQNHIGVLAAGFNTLDNTFLDLNLAENDIGFYSDTAYTFQFLGGSGNNNGTTFHLAACCEWVIDGWREEYGANTQYWIQYGSPAADNHLTVRGSNTVDTLNPHRAFVESIHALTSDATLDLSSSLLNGAVSGKKVRITNTTFTNGAAVVGSPAKLSIFGSCLGDINNGQCTTDLADTGSGGGGVGPQGPVGPPGPAGPQGSPGTGSQPTPTPTAAPVTTPVPTPVAAQTYAARFDSQGALTPTTRNSLATLPLGLTNIGTTAWESSVKLTYTWTANGQTVLYGDRSSLPNTVAPGASVSFSTAVVTPGPGQYTLHIVLVAEPSTYFGAFDLPISIS